MTAKEICEAWVRRCGVPEERVAAEAEAFFNASRTGELQHVFAAYEVLVAEASSGRERTTSPPPPDARGPSRRP